MGVNVLTSTSYYQATGNSKICNDCGNTILEKALYNPILKKEIRIYPICQCEAEKIRQEEELQKQKERQNRLDNLFKQSRLGERFKSATFNNFKISPENKQFHDKMKDYAVNFEDHRIESVLMHSHPGTGKTYITSCVANELLGKGKSVIFVVVPDLLSDIRNTYNSNNPKSEERIMYGLLECDLLILDDIGAERHTSSDDWANEKLFQIINNRYLSNKAIIFTTNLDANELHQKLSARTFSRICEMTNKDFIDMNGIKDIRIYGI